jgi:hypothetical protein
MLPVAKFTKKRKLKTTSTEWGKTWDLIKESVDEKLEDDFARNIKPLIRN